MTTGKLVVCLFSCPCGICFLIGGVEWHGRRLPLVPIHKRFKRIQRRLEPVETLSNSLILMRFFAHWRVSSAVPAGVQRRVWRESVAVLAGVGNRACAQLRQQKRESSTVGLWITLHAVCGTSQVRRATCMGVKRRRVQRALVTVPRLTWLLLAHLTHRRPNPMVSEVPGLRKWDGWVPERI